MSVEVRPDYNADDLSRFEGETGLSADFPLGPAWARAAEVSGYGMGVRAMALVDGAPAGLAQGILRRRFTITTLMIGSNGGVGCVWTPGQEKAAIGCLDDILRRARPSACQIFCQSALPVPRLMWEPAYTFEIDLGPPLEMIESRMSKDARHATRRAERLGVSVRVCEGEEDIARAYELFEGTSEARQFPLPPRKYSLALHREFREEGPQSCALATVGDDLIAAVALLGRGTKVSWWKGGSTERGYRTSAGNLVQREAIRWARERGFRTYDLGGTDPNRPAYAGIHSFKASLGGALVERSLGARSSRGYRVASRVLRAVR